MRKMRLNRASALLLLLLFTLTLLNELPFCNAQLSWSTTYTIKVNADGSAQWTIERKTLLQTENDTVEWWNQTSPEKLLAFQDYMSSVVNQTRQATGRNMSISFVTGTYNLTDTEGIISYQFDWTGFAKIEDQKIEIGDSFIERFLQIDANTLLIIEYPTGFSLATVQPSPTMISTDDRVLSWQGPIDLGVEEPNIVLTESNAQAAAQFRLYMSFTVGAAAFSVVLVSLWHFIHRRRTKSRSATEGQEVILGTEGDEQRIIALLQNAGGTMLQSKITKEFGFSKAKTSLLLNAMEKQGIVSRKKMGREKIVTLTKENKK